MNTEKIKLPFGLNEKNIIVHISAVERGEKCNCFCPDCKSPLIAVKGNIKQHHFRHKDINECKGGLESAIHLAAKQIIMEKKQIILPKYISIASATDSRGILHEKNQIIVRDEDKISFLSVQEEKEVCDMRVDILATTIKGNKPLIIEIYYRHKVDDNKIQKIKKINISAIEINLSDLTLEDVRDMESFWLCINNPGRARWLHNAKDNNKIHPALVKQLKDDIHKFEEKYKQEDIIKQRAEQQEKVRKQRLAQKEKPKLIQALEELSKLRGKENISKLNQEAEIHPAWKLFSRNDQLTLNDLLDFLNVDVPNGDWIFGCDRRIWQAAIYYNFFISPKNEKNYFCTWWIDRWLQHTAGCRVSSCTEIVGRYGRRYPELVPADVLESMPSSWATLRAYFNHLCELGMLIFSGNDRRNRGSFWYQIMSKMPYEVSVPNINSLGMFKNIKSPLFLI